MAELDAALRSAAPEAPQVRSGQVSASQPRRKGPPLQIGDIVRVRATARRARIIEDLGQSHYRVLFFDDPALAAWLAATITESISMGAVAYTSTLAERDRYLFEQGQERAEIRGDPDREREEIRQIYRDKGFSGELLERVVEKITANPEAWVATMMSEELHLEPVDTRAVLRTSVIVAAAAVVGSLLPLLPTLLVPVPVRGDRPGRRVPRLPGRCPVSCQRRLSGVHRLQ